MNTIKHFETFVKFFFYKITQVAIYFGETEVCVSVGARCPGSGVLGIPDSCCQLVGIVLYICRICQHALLCNLVSFGDCEQFPFEICLFERVPHCQKLLIFRFASLPIA